MPSSTARELAGAHENGPRGHGLTRDSNRKKEGDEGELRERIKGGRDGTKASSGLIWRLRFYEMTPVRSCMR